MSEKRTGLSVVYWKTILTARTPLEPRYFVINIGKEKTIINQHFALGGAGTHCSRIWPKSLQNTSKLVDCAAQNISDICSITL